MNRLNFHPQPPHDDMSGPADAGAAGDASLQRLLAQLDAHGGAQRELYAHEARGMSDRIFQASAAELSGQRGSAVAGRIGFARGLRWVAAAAALALAVGVPMLVMRSGEGSGNSGRSSSAGIQTVGFRQSDVLAPAGTSERLVVALFDRDAALDAVDPAAGEGEASVLTTRGSADDVRNELEFLASRGGVK